MTDRTAIEADLDRIIDGARWAYPIAWSKAGRGLTAERGVVHRPDDLGNDNAPGPTFDIETGSHDARIAYQQACTVLADAQRRLQASVTPSQRRMVVLSHYATPDALERAGRNILRLLTLEQPATVLRHVRNQFDQTVRALSKALDVGPADGIAHAEKPCKTCEVRERLSDTKDECETCDRYRRRTGKERPKDRDDVHEARRAQQRRIARGEHWGAA